ncbi:hypothetical protein [Paraburkholderia sp. DHOC27]|uniref:hypothetical protein n=1 Tax=Paraburkholderia sp. DHOC27 TaxID=2303330 RepID=UPI0011C130A4|nr:hypothetical protein [Paraburkholderia sp. DHOC27]
MNPHKRSRSVVEVLEAIKASLLPLPDLLVESLSLRHHIALEMMRLGMGSSEHLHTLMKVVALAGVLADDGYGQLSQEDRLAAQDAAQAALLHGQELGKWFLAADGFDIIAKMVSLHDEQLRIAPFAAVFTAGKQIDQSIPPQTGAYLTW